VREDPTHWSLTAQPGFLRIVSQQGYLFGSGGNAKNLLLQNAPSGDFEIRTHVFFTPTANFQIAGLLVYQDDDNYLLLGRAYCDTAPPTCAGNAIYFDHEEGREFCWQQLCNHNHASRRSILRIIREGTTYSGYYSEDGVSWMLIGWHTVGKNFTPLKIGLTTEDGGTGAPEIPADFDFFQLESCFPVLSYTWLDDFSSTTLNNRWSWLNEDPSQWSLNAHAGFLRIMTDSGYVGDKNLLFQGAPTGDFEIRARVIFTPTSNFQIAGLVLYQNSGNYLLLGRAYCDAAPPGCAGNAIYFDRVESGNFVGSNFVTPTTRQGEANLRVVRQGTTYSGYYSEDGTDWTLIGRHTPSATIALSKIGLTTAQGATMPPTLTSSGLLPPTTTRQR